MNILFLTRRFYPDVGGVETHVLNVAKELIKDGHSVSIVTETNWRTRYISDTNRKIIENIDLTTKSNIRDRIEAKARGEGKILIYHLPATKDGWSKKILIWWCIWKHRYLISRSSIIHAHDVLFWYFPFRILYFWKPIYVTFHGYEGAYPPAQKAIWIRKISEKISWGNICVGEFIKKWYKTKTQFITYGGVEKIQKPANRKQKNTRVLNILFIGRLDNDTNIQTYLQAIEQLQQEKIPFSLQVCGDGMWRQEAEKYGKVHGFVEHIEKYINQADIIFASSYLSILQALAYGKVTISVYDNPLKHDYLQLSPFAKWIYIVRESNEITRIIKEYIRMSDKKIARLLIEEQKWATQQTWKAVTQLYYRLWRI